LVGDFNLYDNIASPVLKQAGFVEVKHGPTYPVDKPDRSIDYIALDGLRAVDVEVVRLPVGDHRAVVVEVEPTRTRLSTAKSKPAAERGPDRKVTTKRKAPAKKPAARRR
jgi:hypothetical protein